MDWLSLSARPKRVCWPPEEIRLAFTGDTLLIGGIGRTDFYSSSAEDLYNSLRKLPKVISPRTLVCPTHDYTNGFATTLQAELRGNVFLSEIADDVMPLSLAEFISKKNKLDQRIDDDKNCELVCGLIETQPVGSHSIDIQPEDLPDFFARRSNALIVDVREPHEFGFAQDWDALGLDRPPENIPLTRLSDFLVRVLHRDSKESDRDIILLCRSGSRSGKAAEVLRRLGVAQVWHIKGGIALGTQRDTIDQDDMEYVI